MGKFNDLLIEIGIDTASAKRDIKKVEQMFDGLAKKLSKPLKVSGGRSGSVSSPLDTKKFKAETQEVIRSIKAMGGEVGKLQNKLNATKSPEGLKAIRKDINALHKDTLIEYKAVQKQKEKIHKAETQAYIEDIKRTRKLEEQAHKQSLSDAKQKKAYMEKMEREAHKENDRRTKAKLKSQKKIHDAEIAAYIENGKREAKARDDLRKRIALADKAQRKMELSSGFRRMPAQQQQQMMQQMAKARDRFLRTGDTYGFEKLNSDIREFRRSMVGLQTVQMGLADSTKNMIRAYASLFALIEGTQAIERIGMDFQGMEVAILASAGSAEKAATDLKFVNSIADEMGTNLKDTADAYVKLQMASRGKMDDREIKELFTGLTEFGTALKVAPESMKLAQRALAQMASKGQIMAI